MAGNGGSMNQETSVELDGPVEDYNKEWDCSSDDEDTPQVKNIWNKLSVL